MALATEQFGIRLPQQVAKRLRRIAEIAHRPIEQVIADRLEATLPSMANDLPTEFEPELLQMESWSNEALRTQVFARFDKTKIELWDELLYKNSTNQLTAIERQQLAEFRCEGDLLTLRKAHAAVILKWRGEPVPTIEEFVAVAEEHGNL